jgi:hypothetical protein
VFYINFISVLLLISESKDSESKDDETETIDTNAFEQSGSGLHKSKLNDLTDSEFISKVAHLVQQQIQPLVSARPVASSWSNVDLSTPSTSAIASVNTNPPLHYDIRQFKNDENDIFGKTTFFMRSSPI